jgi:hypothetical protein
MFGGSRCVELIPRITVRAVNIASYDTTCRSERSTVRTRARIDLTVLMSARVSKSHQSVELVAACAVNTTMFRARRSSSTISACTDINRATVCISHRC